MAGVPGNRLIDAVINDFLRQMIGTGGIGVHARPFLHRFEAC
jgi:hypothetical protein